MDKQFIVKSGLDNAGIRISEDIFGNGKREINDVELSIENSTARAHVFNIALKLAALPCFDPTINTIEKMVDSRLIEIVTGKMFKVICEIGKNGRQWTNYIRANDEERAKTLTIESSPQSIIISVELYIQK
jgi:hypothetical protein